MRVYEAIHWHKTIKPLDCFVPHNDNKSMQKHYYITIKEPFTHEIPKIKWSKFIWYIFPISNKQQAEQYIAQIQKENNWANHNCFAYTYGTNINFDLFWNIQITPDYFKQSDDWEPANTAWKPILSQIQWYKLNNVLIVVTRYFWWTLLGIWWLIQAYWNCAKQTIIQAQKNHEIIQVELTKKLNITCNYSKISIIMHLLNKYDAKIIKQIDWTQAQITFKINKWHIATFKKELSDQTKWKIKL